VDSDYIEACEGSGWKLVVNVITMRVQRDVEYAQTAF